MIILALDLKVKKHIRHSLLTLPAVSLTQPCHCGDPPLRCPPGKREGTGDSEERDWRKLEGASLWTHSRGTQPDTQRHGWGSVSDGLPGVEGRGGCTISIVMYLSGSLFQTWTRQRSWRGSAFAESSLEISHSTLQWCHVSSKTAIWLVLKAAFWAAPWCHKCRRCFPKGPSPRGSGLDYR